MDGVFPPIYSDYNNTMNITPIVNIQSKLSNIKSIRNNDPSFRSQPFVYGGGNVIRVENPANQYPTIHFKSID